MLGFLRRWYINRTRAIFQYWDGRRIRRIDPMAAFRALVAHPEFDWESHPDLIDTGDDEATDITLGAVRDVFGVQAYKGELSAGLTEAETISLLTDFVVYVNALKKNINPSPISPPPTGPDCSGDSTTKPSVDCGSTSTESNCAAPAAS